MIITKTPLRLSLGGGGTDLYYWYKKYGSFFISATINKCIFITISDRKILKDFWLSYSEIEYIKNISLIKHTIIKKILKNYKIHNGIEIHTISQVPSNSGMGSSGALAVGLIKALSVYCNKKISKKSIAEKAFEIEMVINKKNAGKQDQYAASYGGFVAVKINKNGSTTVKKIKISKYKVKKLEENLFLIYVKGNRFASDILKKQNKLLKEKKSKIYLMKKIQELAYRSKVIFESGNIDEIGPVFDQHWQLKKNFGEFMSNKYINSLYDRLKSFGSTGGKIIGAGGGGFLMMYIPSKNIKKFKNLIKKNKINYLSWKFYKKHSEVIYNDEKS